MSVASYFEGSQTRHPTCRALSPLRSLTESTWLRSGAPHSPSSMAVELSSEIGVLDDRVASLLRSQP
jgi:hypothetical protein